MFKKVYFVILILVLNFGYSQDFSDKWKKVYQFELNGKIESAQKEVESIYKYVCTRVFCTFDKYNN
ncbi:MAG: hypothetical protein ACI924_001702 [Flavobacterium sp.]|jgi:hypothetical protein